MGLVKSKEFDLKLDKSISKVIVQNSQGTNTYAYNDVSLAKVEIHSKQMNGSKVTFDYKIVVKNEGTIPGYARKIVDYIPDIISKAKDMMNNKKEKTPSVMVTKEERWTLIKAAFKAYFPKLLLVLGCFLLAMILIYLWLK